MAVTGGLLSRSEWRPSTEGERSKDPHARRKTSPNSMVHLLWDSERKSTTIYLQVNRACTLVMHSWQASDLAGESSRERLKMRLLCALLNSEPRAIAKRNCYREMTAVSWAKATLRFDSWHRS